VSVYNKKDTLNIFIERLHHNPVADLRVEVVELKGTGHPVPIDNSL